MDESITEFEEWKPIPGYKGLYSVSNFGRIKTDAKRNNILRNRQMRPGYKGGEYLRVGLTDRSGCRKTYNVHRVVASAFLGPCEENKQVNHIDGNKFNNSRENLEYISHIENIRHAHNKGLCQSQKGSENNQAKLSLKEVITIRSEFLTGSTTMTMLAKKYRISLPNVSMIINRKTWTHI